jgi:phosphoglycolate phosphatase
VTRRPLVLFDLDGTLVDSFADIAAAVRAACAAVGLEAHADVLAMASRGNPLEDFFRAASGEPSTGPRFRAFVDGYRAHYLPGCTRTTRPYPGIPALLAELRATADPPRLGVATTKRTETARRVLDGTELMRFFDAVSGCDGIPVKPDPAVLRKVAAEAGVSVERAVMVGDTDKDMEAARRAGCAAIGVSWGGFAHAELAACTPEAVVDSVAELRDLLLG